MKKTKIDPVQYRLMGEAIDKMFQPKPFKVEPIPDVIVHVGDPLDHVRFGKGKTIEVDGDECAETREESDYDFSLDTLEKDSFIKVFTEVEV